MVGPTGEDRSSFSSDRARYSARGSAIVGGGGVVVGAVLMCLCVCCQRPSQRWRKWCWSVSSRLRRARNQLLFHARRHFPHHQPILYELQHYVPGSVQSQRTRGPKLLTGSSISWLANQGDLSSSTTTIYVPRRCS